MQIRLQSNFPNHSKGCNGGFRKILTAKLIFTRISIVCKEDAAFRPNATILESRGSFSAAGSGAIWPRTP